MILSADSFASSWSRAAFKVRSFESTEMAFESALISIYWMGDRADLFCSLLGVSYLSFHSEFSVTAAFAEEAFAEKGEWS